MTRKLRRSYSLGVGASFFAVLIVLTAQASSLPLFVLPVNYDSQNPGALVVADINGDGKLDLVVTGCGGSCGNTDGVVMVRLGNGDGTFRPAAVYGSGGVYAESVAVEDLNHDGKPDVVVANCAPSGTGPCQTGSMEGVVGVLLGNGDGTLRHAVTYDSGGLSAESIAVADVNRDGKPDLVVANSGLGYGVGVLLGKGDGTFQPPSTYSPNTQIFSLAVADVNGDGNPDIVGGGAIDGQISIGVLMATVLSSHR